MNGSWWQEHFEAAFPPAEPVMGISAQLAASEAAIEHEKAVHSDQQPVPQAFPEPATPQVNQLAADSVSAGPEPAELAQVVELRPRRQCTAHSARTGERCRRSPVLGTHVCATHGGRIPAVRDKAARRVQEAKAAELAAKMIGQVKLADYADPFEALEFVTSYSFAFAERMAKVVEAIPDAQLRYEGKTGDFLRGEVVAMQKALADAGKVATDSLRLGLAERRLRVEEGKIDLVERALMAALKATGLDDAGQRQARRALRAELRAIEARDA